MQHDACVRRDGDSWLGKVSGAGAMSSNLGDAIESNAPIKSETRREGGEAQRDQRGGREGGGLHRRSRPFLAADPARSGQWWVTELSEVLQVFMGVDQRPRLLVVVTVGLGAFFPEDQAVKEFFLEKRFGAQARGLLGDPRALGKYASQGYDLSLRQLYYQLVAPTSRSHKISSFSSRLLG